MEATIEITMYPLREDYEEQVLNFIELLQDKNDLILRVNAMSTQVTGDLDRLMVHVNEAIKTTYLEGVKAAFVLKILPGILDLEFKM